MNICKGISKALVKTYPWGIFWHSYIILLYSPAQWIWLIFIISKDHFLCEYQIFFHFW